MYKYQKVQICALQKVAATNPWPAKYATVECCWLATICFKFKRIWDPTSTFCLFCTAYSFNIFAFCFESYFDGGLLYFTVFKHFKLTLDKFTHFTRTNIETFFSWAVCFSNRCISTHWYAAIMLLNTFEQNVWFLTLQFLSLHLCRNLCSVQTKKH